MKDSWEDHYRHLEDKSIPPAATLSKALSLFEEESLEKDKKNAIDLGCGNGIDAMALLKNDWNVLAIDHQPEALNRLTAEANSLPKGLLRTRCITFESLQKLPKSLFINATFSLPFCKPDRFDHLWDLIVSAIQPGGRFGGQFFGVNDSWNTNPKMNFQTSDSIKKLFKNFTIESFTEVEKQGKTVSGSDKYWHVFHIVAKRDPS